MRRALKIKASIFLFAWSAIFVHNIIPHNHETDCFQGCTNLLHKEDPCTSDEGRSFRFGNEHPDSTVCHLSNFLFHNLSPEAFLSCTIRDVNFNPENQEVDFCSNHDHFYISDHLNGATSLRAPPAVS